MTTASLAWLTSCYLTGSWANSTTRCLNHLTAKSSNHFGNRVLAKAAAQVTEARKHQTNNPKCLNLGGCVSSWWLSYGAWGEEDSDIIFFIASRLATSMCKPKSVVLNDIYGRLNVQLVRVNAMAILSTIA